MNGSRFDALTRWAARPTTRRAALGSAGAGIAALAVGRVAAQEASPVASPAASTEVALLFVQTGATTTLTPGTGDVHTLTITGVTSQTLYFADRPNRITGAMPTATFVESWAEAFGDSPPNATLIGHPEAEGDTEEAVVVELMNPTYDAASATLTYAVRLIGAEEIADRTFEQEPLTVLDAPRQYAQAHLFIDDMDPADFCDYCFQIYQDNIDGLNICLRSCGSMEDFPEPIEDFPDPTEDSPES
jgi:hypothetical protein